MGLMKFNIGERFVVSGNEPEMPWSSPPFHPAVIMPLTSKVAKLALKRRVLINILLLLAQGQRS